MADPQEPILVLEDDAGVCTFPTSGEAVAHDYGDSALRLEFFDAAGRRLEPVGDPPSGLQVADEEDQGPYVRARARAVLERQVDQARTLINTLDRVLEQEPELSFTDLVEQLAAVLNPFRTIDAEAQIAESIGTWGHYATAAHHR